MARKLSVIIDDVTDVVLRRVAPPGEAGAYIRAGILEKAARDEHSDALAGLQAAVAEQGRRIAALEADRGPQRSGSG